MARYAIHPVICGRADRERRYRPRFELGVPRIPNHSVGNALAFCSISKLEDLLFAARFEDDLLLTAPLPLHSSPGIGILVGRQRGMSDLCGQLSFPHADIRASNDRLFHTSTGSPGVKVVATRFP